MSAIATSSKIASSRANAAPSRTVAPKSMLLLRRAADAAGYAVACPTEEPAPRARVSAAPALMLGSLICAVGVALAIY